MPSSVGSVIDQSNKVTDPVCGMSIVPGETKLVTLYDGHSYWFCAEVCRDAFDANPKKYLERKKTKRKSWLGRYLAKMAKANQEEFGCAGPKCH